MDIAILGFGTIGSGVDELLKGNKDIYVKTILDLNAWQANMTTDIENIIKDDSIKTVVETMGGIHPAFEYAIKCIEAGKNYVTANKLLVSQCALELQKAALKNNVALLFSAACGGGIPYLYNLEKTAQTDKIISLGGILNGTTNYILDKLFTDGVSYAEALKEAQALGYAERDPSSDVDGLDTMRKLMLSSAVAFGRIPQSESIPCYGIRNINDIDVKYAKDQNAVIKLIANASTVKENKLEAFVMPRLFKNGTAESSIRLNVNYAWYKGERIGEFGFTGHGAGKFPTANNIVRDVYTIMMGEKRMLPDALESVPADGSSEKRFYVRAPESSAKDLTVFSESLETNAQYAIIKTKPISFNKLSDALKGVEDYFVMLLED